MSSEVTMPAALPGERTVPSALPNEVTHADSPGGDLDNEVTSLSRPPSEPAAAPPAVIVDSRSAPLPWEQSPAPVLPATPAAASAAEPNTPRKFKTMGMNMSALGGLPAAPTPPRPPVDADDPLNDTAASDTASASATDWSGGPQLTQPDPPVSPLPDGPVASSGEEPTAVDGKLSEMWQQLRAQQDGGAPNPPAPPPNPAVPNEAYPSTTALPGDWMSRLQESDAEPPIQQRDLPSLPASTSSPPAAEPAVVPENRRGTPRWLMMALGFVGVIVILGGCVGLAVLLAAM